LRRPERFTQFLNACASDARGRLGHEQDEYPEADFLKHVLHAFKEINAGDIARRCKDKRQIADQVRLARISAVKSCVGAFSWESSSEVEQH
jgi:tRNA nucleotidyltransferase (CCA-adding enzyme)